MDTAFMFVGILIFVAVTMIMIALLCRACRDGTSASSGKKMKHKRPKLRKIKSGSIISGDNMEYCENIEVGDVDWRDENNEDGIVVDGCNDEGEYDYGGGDNGGGCDYGGGYDGGGCDYGGGDCGGGDFGGGNE